MGVHRWFAVINACLLSTSGQRSQRIFKYADNPAAVHALNNDRERLYSARTRERKPTGTVSPIFLSEQFWYKVLTRYPNTDLYPKGTVLPDRKWCLYTDDILRYFCRAPKTPFPVVGGGGSRQVVSEGRSTGQ